jgi:hypothetical protein
VRERIRERVFGMEGEVSGWIPQELGLGQRKKKKNSRTKTALDLSIS